MKISEVATWYRTEEVTGVFGPSIQWRPSVPEPLAPVVGVTAAGVGAVVDDTVPHATSRLASTVDASPERIDDFKSSESPLVNDPHI
jgi:hypothetical protein